jgi:predicted RNA methylase
MASQLLFNHTVIPAQPQASNDLAAQRGSAEIYELGQFIPAVYHCNMLADEARMSAFEEAIALTVRPGHRVLEFGGGTGVLSFFASRSGAEVLCVERNPELVAQARTLLKDNGAEHQVTVIKADALDYVPPHPVDLVLCEMVHVGMLRERQLLVIDSFKPRYLQAFGRPLPQFIPEAFFQAVQPVQHDFDFHGFVAPMACFQDSGALQPRTRTLGEPVVYHAGVYRDSYSMDCSWSGPLLMQHSGHFNALRFITKNVLAVLESQQRTIDWTSQYLVVPLDVPLTVLAGQTVALRFSYRAGDPIRTLRPQVG